MSTISRRPPQNTYDLLLAVRNKMRAVPKGRGLGVMCWEPEGDKAWSGYPLSAWGSNGRPASALSGFLYEPVPVANPGFEATAATQTPSGGTSWSNGNHGAGYTGAGGPTGRYRLAHRQSTAYRVGAYQLKTGLATGTCTPSAWVSGGQTACQLYAKHFGGTGKDCPLPVTSTGTRIQISGIRVTNGQGEIGLWSDAATGAASTTYSFIPRPPRGGPEHGGAQRPPPTPAAPRSACAPTRPRSRLPLPRPPQLGKRRFAFTAPPGSPCARPRSRPVRQL